MLKNAFNIALLVFFFLSLSNELFTQPQWRLLPGSPGSNDVSFVNSKTGWAGGFNGIFKTTNGGLNWVRTDPASGTTIRSILFIDSITGFAGSLDSSEVLFRTTNGGTNWFKVQNIPQPVPNGICGIFMVEDIIYATGVYYGPSVLIKSTDRGNTWQSINMSSYSTGLIDCYFWSADSGIVAGGLGSPTPQRKAIILSTYNGGLTWQQKALSVHDSNYCWKISFPSRYTGYVAIQKINLGAQTYFKTTDGGETWSEIETLITQYHIGVGFVNDMTGWLGRCKTTDGGVTWLIYSPNISTTNRYRFYGDTLGYAAGGQIYKYTADSTIGINNNQSTSPKDFHLYQNYPNPFNPATTIKFEVFLLSLTKLKIYNSLGQEVYSFLDGYQIPGTRNFTWDGTNMNGEPQPSGIYFYTIETEKYKESKKMILVR